MDVSEGSFVLILIHPNLHDLNNNSIIPEYFHDQVLGLEPGRWHFFRSFRKDVSCLY